MLTIASYMMALNWPDPVLSGGRTLLWFFFVIGIMIFVHEFGHFMVAKLLKIRVETFSLGFGPKLLKFRRGDTEYCLSALPLGGYVKMAGENFEEAVGAPDEFLSRPKTQRFLVAVAGPAMNLVLAVALMTAYCMMGVQQDKFMKEPAYIGGIAKGSPAEQAGLMVGDKIVRINGRPIDSWESAILTIAINSKQPLVIDVERNGQIIEKEVMPNRETASEIGTIGVEPYMWIEAVQPNSPAEKAGLQSGDAIVKVQGPDKTETSITQVLDIISHSPDAPLTVTVRRGTTEIVKQITPALERDVARGRDVGRIGVSLGVTEKYDFPHAVVKSFNLNVEAVRLTFQVLRGLFAGRAPLKNLSGPIGIAQMSGEAARAGKSTMIQFMGMVSLNLGIMNLLPIPILDGGVIFLILLEGLRRKDFSIAVKEKIIYVGFIFLILLMGIVIVNDLSKLSFFGHLFK